MEIGSFVKMSKEGKWRWPRSSANPHDSIGVVISRHETPYSIRVRVKWGKNIINSYYKEDLVVLNYPLTKRWIKA